MHWQFFKALPAESRHKSRSSGRRYQRAQGTNEIARRRDREMRRQRGAIGPLLDENETEPVLAIDMHGMRDASGLGARTLHMLEADPARLFECLMPRWHAAGHHDHS